MAYTVFFLACLAAAGYQLSRVRRVWAFLILFIALMPKVAVAVVPGNATPLRVDDLVLVVVIGAWIVQRLFTPAREGEDRIPPSPASFFLLLYWGVAAACTLVGIAAPTTTPLTGVLHVGRLIEYGLLYYLFYTSIDPDELPQFVEVVRTALLLVVAIWIGQHWTHAPVNGPPTPWATLYPTFSATYDFGGFVMLTTVLLYAVWSTGASRSAATTVALAAGAFVTVNSESRASLLGLALVVGIDVALRARWWALVVLGAAAAAAPYLLRSRKMKTLFSGVVALLTLRFDVIRQAFATDPSLALRMRNWSIAIDHWRARPFVGDGLGGYIAYTRQYDMPATPDGWYVRVLADSGVAGLTAFLLLIGALIWTLVSAARRETDVMRHAIVYAAALAVVAASVSAVLVDTFVSYKIMGMFWTIVACGTRVAAREAAA
jgi:O-antigen ligase